MTTTPVQAAGAGTPPGELLRRFREYLTVHPGIELGGHDMDNMALDLTRIQAAWNACEGISTEALATGPTMMAAFQREQDRADKAERDMEKLRAALEAIAAGNTDPDSMVELAQQALAEPTEAAEPGKRTVTIPACEAHEGSESVTLTLPWCCIHCGGPRGEPAIGTSWDGSRQLAVHTWTNPCGHTEKYSQLREWAASPRKIVLPAGALAAGMRQHIAWKDHQTAQLVNELRDCAAQFGQTQQLRERIATIVAPLCSQLKDAQGLQDDGRRSDAEIVERTEAAARFLLEWKYGLVPEVVDAQLRHSKNTKAQWAWDAACKLQEIITDTDAINAAQEVDDEEPEAAGTQEPMATSQVPGFTDEQIEDEFAKAGGRWTGDHWIIEDADLHPYVRKIERRIANAGPQGGAV